MKIRYNILDFLMRNNRITTYTKVQMASFTNTKWFKLIINEMAQEDLVVVRPITKKDLRKDKTLHKFLPQTKAVISITNRGELMLPKMKAILGMIHVKELR